MKPTITIDYPKVWMYLHLTYMPLRMLLCALLGLSSLQCGTTATGGAVDGPQDSPADRMQVFCSRFGMDETKIAEALENWSSDRDAGYSKEDVVAYHIAPCVTLALSDPDLEEDCYECVDAIADAVFGED